MDLTWTKEQLDYKQKVINFAKNNLNNSLSERDRDCVFSREDWQKCADFGIQGLASPRKYGGQNDEVDILTATLAMEGLGFGCRDNGLPFSLNAQMWTVQLPIAQFGSEFQKDKYLKALSSGKWIGCHGLTETNAGSDVFNMETVAEKVEGGYILNGNKRLITLGPIADIALIFAKTNPKIR